MPGVRDVARLAGVSATTVSRALRGDSYVAAATRDRVLRAASQLAYSLPQPPHRPTLVVVLVRSPARWFYSEAISGIERVLIGTDHRLVLHSIGDPHGRRLFFEHVVPRGQLDAAVVVSSSFDEVESAALRRLRVPITVVGGYFPGLTRVGIDDEAAARMATRHLIGLGHRHIGMITLAPEDLVGQRMMTARRRGFEAALSEAGIPVRPESIIAAGGSRLRDGVRATEELLTIAKVPSALFAMTDELAFGALYTLRRAGISVPAHMSVVGFDDHEMSEFSNLTTISQPVRLQAEIATRLLMDRLNGKTDDVVSRDMPTRLVIRGTTASVR